MFPNQDSTLTEQTSPLDTIGVGIIPSFDFETGDFNVLDGAVVQLTKVEALKMWVKKVLLTNKYRFKVYTLDDTVTYDYGVSLESYINTGLPYNIVKAQLQKEITDTLVYNKYIDSCSNFEFERDGSLLTISFTINSTYGDIEEEVTINV